MISRVIGTKDQVADYLAGCVSQALEEDGSEYDEDVNCGSTIDPADVIEQNGKLYACAVFSDSHIDWTAVPEECVVQKYTKRLSD